MHHQSVAKDISPSPENGWLYPFSALVGQAEMKRVLLLASIDPSLGGVLILGERGTAKSTAARGLARLWPDGRSLVTLPLGATEDRVVGSLDFESALVTGRLRPEKGLLARADNGILYIDEINLLDEHLAALILDAAASGYVRVEREGLSFGYPSRFLLIGTMNPEEGSISPQLLDRFGLTASVSAEPDPVDRKELIRRRLAFESAPAEFVAAWEKAERQLSERLAEARQRLGSIPLGDDVYELAGRLAEEAAASGQRAELALVKAARAWAAWQGRDSVAASDVFEVAEAALSHRRRVRVSPRQRVEVAPSETKPMAVSTDVPRAVEAPVKGPERRVGQAGEGEKWSVERIHAANAPFKLATIDPARRGGWLKSSGRSLKRETSDGSGRYVRASMERLGREVALDATLRAAAPNQKKRDKGGLSLAVRSSDIREKVKVKSTGRLVLFVVDGSGSMGSLLRMQEAKAAILSLLAEAYQKRDRVGMVAFRGQGAEVLLPPTNSVELAQRCLEELPTGGKTPLAEGLMRAFEVVSRELTRDPKLDPLVVLLTDGKPNVTLAPDADPWEEVLDLAGRLRRPGLSYLVVDTDWSHWMSRNVNRRLAERLNAGYVKLDQLRAEGLVRLVRERANTRAKR